MYYSVWNYAPSKGYFEFRKEPTRLTHTWYNKARRLLVTRVYEWSAEEIIFLESRNLGGAYDDFALRHLHYKKDIRDGQFKPVPTLFLVN